MVPVCAMIHLRRADPDRTTGQAGRSGTHLGCSITTEPSFLRDTRAAYNSVAAAHAERFQGELAGKPLDRALFAALRNANLPYGLLHPSWGAHEPG